MNIDFSFIWTNASLLKQGFFFTLQLSAIAIVGGLIFGLIFGLVLALARYSKFTVLRVLAGLYVDLMRAVPLLLALFWIFFLAPLMLQWVSGAPRPVKVGPDKTAIVAFILFEAAYYCEIIRSGIRSVSAGQWSAAQALGMSKYLLMRHVVLPQAVRNMIPVFLTQAIILFQDTSLVYVMSVTDFLGATSIIGIRDGNLVGPYLFAAAVYLAISIVLTAVVHYLSKKSRPAPAAQAAP